MSNILRIDASARNEGSTTRQLADQLVTSLAEQNYGATVTRRDLLAVPPALLSESWVGANFTDESARSDEQKALLAASDELIAELEAADTIVITAPIYNFAIPAALKAWIDQIARARRTFRYTEAGPEGLLKGKRAYIVFASGGVPLGSAVDFASGYLTHILGFIGITDVRIVAADGHQVDGEALARAASTIDGLKQAAGTARRLRFRRGAGRPIAPPCSCPTASCSSMARRSSSTSPPACRSIRRATAV